MIALNSPTLFKPGRLVATPALLEALDKSGQSIWTFLARHLAGDWGIVSDDDKRANDESLKDGSRLLSAYLLNDGEKTKIWFITEAENDKGLREATTVLLPEEY